MATKTKAGIVRVPQTFEITGLVIARILASECRVDKGGDFVLPGWARTRTATLRGVGLLLVKNGLDFYTADDSWKVEIIPQDVCRALSAGRAVVARFSPEL